MFTHSTLLLAVAEILKEEGFTIEYDWNVNKELNGFYACETGHLPIRMFTSVSMHLGARLMNMPFNQQVKRPLSGIMWLNWEDPHLARRIRCLYNPQMWDSGNWNS